MEIIAAALDNRYNRRHLTVHLHGFKVSGELQASRYLPGHKVVQLSLKLRRPTDDLPGHTPGLPAATVLLTLPRLFPVQVHMGAPT